MNKNNKDNSLNEKYASDSLIKIDNIYYPLNLERFIATQTARKYLYIFDKYLCF